MENKTIQNDLEKYFDRLWPICRSITGKGLRDSLNILSEIVPLEIEEVPSGTEVFDWTVPKEWNIREAWIECPDGRKIADFSTNNLHVVNYSVPVNAAMSFDDLKSHLHSIESKPDAIPYITSYYHSNWGFCISHKELESLPKDGIYQVYIDSDLSDGSLTYGEAVLPGTTDREILFSTYVCHPSMAINELSGPLVAAFLYQKLASLSGRKYTYRFVFAPETIGIIAFLHKRGAHLKSKIDAGYVITCVGHEGKFTFKKSKKSDTPADKIAQHYLKYSNKEYEIINYAIGGSDERQYCSPGFNLPVGSLMRTMYKLYPEYHTSLDNKSIISFAALEETVNAYFDICRIFEINEKYINRIPFCEPQLGKRGLYPQSGAWQNRQEFRLNLLHFLSYADGEIDLVDIAENRERCVLEFEDVISACQKNDLI
jgi:aminopeptidase-like protein